MGGWEDVVASSHFELVDITLRSDLGRICVSRLWEIRFGRPTDFGSGQVLTCKSTCWETRLWKTKLWETRLWKTKLSPPILDLVGFSPGSPHAGRSFRLLQSEAIDFGSGDAHSGLPGVYTLEGYNLGLPILDLEMHELDCWQSTL